MTVLMQWYNPASGHTACDGPGYISTDPTFQAHLLSVVFTLLGLLLPFLVMLHRSNTRSCFAMSHELKSPGAGIIFVM